MSTAFEIANKYWEYGATECAAEHYAKAYEQEPHRKEVALRYATALTCTSRSALAAQVLEDTLKRFPLDTELQHLTGIVMYRLDRYDDALAMFEAVMLQAKGNATVLLDYAVCLRTIGDDRSADQALACYRRMKEEA